MQAADLASLVRVATGREIVGRRPLSGGSVGAVEGLTLDDGRVLVAKSGAGLRSEAWMLDYLRAKTTLPVPRVYHGDDRLLLMEALPGVAGRLDRAAESDLARHVAALHGVGAQAFGLDRATVIGGLIQPNMWSDDWVAFYRDRRVLFMAHAAAAAGQVPLPTLRRIERLAARFGDHLPPRPAVALLHGDLWGGNILARPGAVTGFIDPALYYGDAEIDLAFLTLFQSVGPAFFAAYDERRPIAPGFAAERRPLYLLYPLLVHVRLFGAAYVGQVEDILKRFGV